LRFESQIGVSIDNEWEDYSKRKKRIHEEYSCLGCNAMQFREIQGVVRLYCFLVWLTF
jgi:hypothetical protein